MTAQGKSAAAQRRRTPRWVRCMGGVPSPERAQHDSDARNGFLLRPCRASVSSSPQTQGGDQSRHGSLDLALGYLVWPLRGGKAQRYSRAIKTGRTSSIPHTQTLLAFALTLVACFSAAPTHAQRVPATSPASDAEIARLVERLGSEDYFERRDAEQQLLQIGPQAFDSLKKAERDPDLEVASRAAYILRQLRVRWSRADDPAEVRRLLNRFDELAADRRFEIIDALSRLGDHAGVGALSRIARFDGTPHVARHAALTLIEMDLDGAQSARAQIEREVGPSRRAPATWLRVLAEELRDPASSAGQWRAITEEEAALLVSGDEDTAWRFVERLWEHELEVSDRRGAADAAAAVLVHRITVAAALEKEEEDSLKFALRWCLQRKQWGALEIMQRQYADAINARRDLTYFVAAAKVAQGDVAEGNLAAERAYHMAADDDEQRCEIATEIADLGQLDWAEREWKYVIANFSEVDVNSVVARFKLASWLYDRQEFQSAAELLATSCDAIAGNNAERARLKHELEEHPLGFDLNHFIGLRDYYAARHFKQTGDHEEEARRLELAAATYERNIDVLIAMVRSEGGDQHYQARAQLRIKKAKQGQAEEIKRCKDPAIRDNQHVRDYLANLYNEWAWLTANTSKNEKQLRKAVEYSELSLKLRPNESAFLDTLGHCYHAVGEHATAVKYQRLAVQQEPNLQYMQRQLAKFEQALADGTKPVFEPDQPETQEPPPTNAPKRPPRQLRIRRERAPLDIQPSARDIESP